MAGELSYTAETTVPLDRAAAFELWLDVDRYHEWQQAVRRVVNMLGAADRPGSSYTLDHGPALKLNVTVVAVERPDLYRIRQAGLGTDLVITARFEPVDAGSTRIEVIVEHAQRHGGITRWLMRQGGRFGNRAVRDELERFRLWIGREASSSRPERPLNTE